MISNRLFSKYFEPKVSVEVSEKDGIRYLHLGSRTVQSAMRISNPTELVLPYTRAMMSFLLFNSDPRSIALFGLGGGSLSKYCYHKILNAKIKVIEKNREVLNVAKRQFFVPEDDCRFKVVIQSGEKWLENNAQQFDVFLIDAFDRHSQIAALASLEFYKKAYDSMSQNGILVTNCWTKDSGLEKNLKNLRNIFFDILVIPSKRKGNVAVLAFKTQPCILTWEDLQERAGLVDKSYDLQFTEIIEDLKGVNLYGTNRKLL